MATFLKNSFIFKVWTLNKIILEGLGFRGGSDKKMRRMWFGREIVVAELPSLFVLAVSYKFMPEETLCECFQCTNG